MARFRKATLISAFLIAACAVQIKAVAEPPQDPCSPLSASEVSAILGETYDSPQSTVAPRPYLNTPNGTDCTYRPNGSGSSLVLRIYIDASATVSEDVFDKLRRFVGGGTPVSGIGEEAYFDVHHALHVRKSNVRFYLNLGDPGKGTAANEAPLQTLGGLVAGRL